MTNDTNTSAAMECARIQQLAQATLTGKGLSEREFRGWLLPHCARAGLSADTFEWIARTVYPMLEG